MKLIVGLGNPGLEYEKTRHNIGFRFLDLYMKFLNINNLQNKFNGLYAKININGEDIIFLKPLSYMNLSGEVILKFVKYYKILPENILVIHDDLDMELAKIKLKDGGSSGGHNGLKNIILNLKTEEFKRLKVGIGKNLNIETAVYVLSKFTNQEEEKINNLNETIISILNDYLNLKFPDLMSKYNNNKLNSESI